MGAIMINGKFRNYGNVRVNFFGRTATTVQKIDYEREDAIDPVNVVGSTKTAGFTQGLEKCSGSITLLSEEVDAIQKDLPPGKTLMDIPAFPISISYVDDLGLLVSHTLISCKFKKNSRSAESGSNDALKVEIPLFIGDINFNA